MTTTAQVSSLVQLQGIFPGVLMLDAHSLAAALGIAHKTLNNAGANFPIRPIRFGRRKYYRVVDVAAYIDFELGLSLSSPAPLPAPQPASVAPVPIKRGRGRPRKTPLLGLGNE